MSTLKIVEFRPEGMSPFIQFLQYLAKKKSWDWQFETLPEFSMEALNGAHAAKVFPRLSADILPQLKVLPSQVRSIETLDSFFNENGTWYPRLLLHEALKDVLISEARDLDIRAPAFVVGDNNEARVAAAVLAEMGVSDIYLVGAAETLQPQKEILARAQIGIRFHILIPDDLTLQAVSAGIIVNTVDLSQQKSLLTDLSYFNFMKHKGYALDLNLIPSQNLLLEEAEKAELRVLSPVLVATVLSQMWLQRLNVTGVALTELRDEWNHFLKENNF